MTNQNQPSKAEIVATIKQRQSGLRGARIEDIAADVDSSAATVREVLMELEARDLVREQSDDGESRWQLTGRVNRGP